MCQLSVVSCRFSSLSSRASGLCLHGFAEKTRFVSGHRFSDAVSSINSVSASQAAEKLTIRIRRCLQASRKCWLINHAFRRCGAECEFFPQPLQPLRSTRGKEMSSQKQFSPQTLISEILKRQRTMTMRSEEHTSE